MEHRFIETLDQRGLAALFNHRTFELNYGGAFSSTGETELSPPTEIRDLLAQRQVSRRMTPCTAVVGGRTCSPNRVVNIGTNTMQSIYHISVKHHLDQR